MSKLFWQVVSVLLVVVSVFFAVFFCFGDNQPMFFILVFFSGFVSLLASAAALDAIDKQYK